MGNEIETRCIGNAHMISLTMMKTNKYLAFLHLKMKSVQSMLATWDLGIMIEHENFGLDVNNSDGDGLINGVRDHITY